MKLINTAFLIILFVMNTNAQNWEGRWEGTLVAGPQELTIVFNIKKGKDNALTATMDSPDQMAYDLKMDEVITKENKISIKFKAGNAAFEGQLSDDNNKIKGEWIQGMEFPLDLVRSEKKADQRPQEPKAPFPYKIEEVTYQNSKAKIELAGTLTIPEGTGKFPVVILISGSGPQDRDATIFKHKSFWVLADYLTRKGIAVLRVDDRGVGKSTGNFATATSADFATDVIAGVDFLKKHPSIDTKKIGLMGHSEGGFIAPMVASKDKRVAFAILLAGPGVPGKDLLIQQKEDLMKLAQMDEAQLKMIRAVSTKLYTAIVNDKKSELGVSELLDSVKDELATVPEEDKQALGLDEVSLRQLIATLRGTWLHSFLSSVPENYLTKVKCPVLALNGDKDLQVSGKANLDAIENAFKKGKNSNYQCVLLPNLNHLFQNCETGGIEEYAKIEETFAPEAMELIFEFINGIWQ